MTIVGMVPPVYYKGDLLVDGGYMNNIPVDVMRSMGVDTVTILALPDLSHACASSANCKPPVAVAC